MGVPPGAKSYHTVWIRHGGERPVPVRYALAGDRLVAFGEPLSHIRDGEPVTAAIHEIAGGRPVFEFGAVLRDVPGDAVEAEAFLDLLAHVPLGRSAEEIEESVRRHRSTRRVVEIAARQ